MLKVKSQIPNKEFVAFIHDWFELLAHGKLEEACQKIDKPNSYGITWTPEKIIEVVNDNFGPGTTYFLEHPEGPVFSNVSETEGKFRADVIRFNDGSGYSVEHDLPLNKEWSDLTAQFEFIGGKREFEVILHDIHVL